MVVRAPCDSFRLDEIPVGDAPRGDLNHGSDWVYLDRNGMTVGMLNSKCDAVEELPVLVVVTRCEAFK